MSERESQARYLEELAAQVRKGEAFLHAGRMIKGDGTVSHSLVAITLGEGIDLEVGPAHMPTVQAEYAVARMGGPDYAACFAERIIRERDWERFEMFMVDCEDRVKEEAKLSIVVEALRLVWDASRQGDNGEWNYLEAIAAKAVEMIRVIDW